MSSAKDLTLEQYKAARRLLANQIVAPHNPQVYMTFESPESSDYLLAEKLLDAGVIDIDALGRPSS